MEPTRESHATLIDLLERVLDKGLIIDADVIISVAGIPLLGIKLNAAIAGMDTMLKWGIWKDWDDAQRMAAVDQYRRQGQMSSKYADKEMLAIGAGGLKK